MSDTNYEAAIDWYRRRHELTADLIFQTPDGLIKLDRRVPGDGTKWYVANWYGSHWSYEDGTVEPSDLMGQPLDGALPALGVA